MTTATPTAGTILALDLGKYKSVACAYDPAGAEARRVVGAGHRPLGPAAPAGARAAGRGRH